MSREKEIYRVTLVGSVVNALLLAFKFVAGIVGHSTAMVADAVHSLSDFLTDILVIVFVRISSKPEDKTHEYGHGKYETIASFLIAIGLMGVAIGIIVNGGQKLSAWLRGEDLAAPGQIALWAALISIVMKEALFWYTIRRGKALDSQAMVANAWHHRSDALSSIGAAIGIGGALLLGSRWTVLDPIAGIIVGLMLVHTAVELIGGSMSELTEGSLPEETEQEIRQLILSVNGVEDPHELRTRRIGNHIAVDVHVRMDGDMTLREAHDRSSEIEQRIRERFGEESYVSVHMEPRVRQSDRTG